jgi:TfoX/Sxy family transcriptional regulator of competence genes
MKRGRKVNRAEAVPGDVDSRFAPVVAAFARDAHVTPTKMFGAVGLKVNGKVFAILVKGKFVAKLPKERVDAIVTSGSGKYFDPGHGRPSKEWIALSAASPPWVDLAKEAYRFVKGRK